MSRKSEPSTFSTGTDEGEGSLTLGVKFLDSDHDNLVVNTPARNTIRRLCIDIVAAYNSAFGEQVENCLVDLFRRLPGDDELFRIPTTVYWTNETFKIHDIVYCRIHKNDQLLQDADDQDSEQAVSTDINLQQTSVPAQSLSTAVKSSRTPKSTKRKVTESTKSPRSARKLAFSDMDASHEAPSLKKISTKEKSTEKKKVKRSQGATKRAKPATPPSDGESSDSEDSSDDDEVTTAKKPAAKRAKQATPSSDSEDSNDDDEVTTAKKPAAKRAKQATPLSDQESSDSEDSNDDDEVTTAKKPVVKRANQATPPSDDESSDSEDSNDDDEATQLEVVETDKHSKVKNLAKQGLTPTSSVVDELNIITNGKALFTIEEALHKPGVFDSKANLEKAINKVLMLVDECEAGAISQEFKGSLSNVHFAMQERYSLKNLSRAFNSLVKAWDFRIVAPSSTPKSENKTTANTRSNTESKAPSKQTKTVNDKSRKVTRSTAQDKTKSANTATKPTVKKSALPAKQGEKERGTLQREKGSKSDTKSKTEEEKSPVKEENAKIIKASNDDDKNGKAVEKAALRSGNVKSSSQAVATKSQKRIKDPSHEISSSAPKAANSKKNIQDGTLKEDEKESELSGASSSQGSDEKSIDSKPDASSSAGSQDSEDADSSDSDSSATDTDDDTKESMAALKSQEQTARNRKAPETPKSKPTFATPRARTASESSSSSDSSGAVSKAFPTTSSTIKKRRSGLMGRAQSGIAKTSDTSSQVQNALATPFTPKITTKWTKFPNTKRRKPYDEDGQNRSRKKTFLKRKKN